MLQIHTLRENLEEVKRKLAKKQVKHLSDLDTIVHLDDKRKHLKVALEANLAEATGIATSIFNARL